MNNRSKEELIQKYKHATNSLILLDYDGTLVDYTTVPATAKLSEHLFEILTTLASNHNTQVYIITGRGRRDIDNLTEHLPVNIIAEHGAMIRRNGVWKNQINNKASWKRIIIPILDQITLTCPDSYTEEKEFSLAWHYRGSESEKGYYHSRELICKLEKIIQFYNLKLLDGNRVVEIMDREVGKGKAVKKLSSQNHYDFILSVGDDVTDEEMFEFFSDNTNAFTIRVGNGDTFARYRLAGITDVVSLLKYLSK